MQQELHRPFWLERDNSQRPAQGIQPVHVCGKNWLECTGRPPSKPGGHLVSRLVCYVSSCLMLGHVGLLMPPPLFPRVSGGLNEELLHGMLT